MVLNRKSSRARLMGGVAVAAVVVFASAAHAQAKTISIEPQPLSTALYELGVQTGQQIIFSPSLASTKMTRGVDDTDDVELALGQILRGTGLSYRRTADAFLIVQAGEGGSGPQSASAGGDVDALIVTAQKREENIQDVPIAISAFTQEDLTTHQIAGGPDLITQVPNMTFTKTNFSSYSVQLRGIGTQAISATTDPAVAVAFNNTPFIRNRFFEQEFYDLNRIEVLRGPQGTLYGRNATAGVVNIISAKPKFLYEAKASADVSNFNSSRIEAMVNLPLAEDAVALRLAGAWTKRDGYATNELTGNPIDGRDLWSTRLSLRFAPTDAVDVNLIWEHFEEDDDRLRSGKQLCKKDVVTQVGNVTDIPYLAILPNAGQNTLFAGVQAYLSQGCERVSLYSPDAFQTPNGLMLPFYLPISAVGLPVGPNPDPYLSATQSLDLRMIESTRDPDYRAKADLAELQVSVDITDGLTITSETAYSRDFVWSMQDFNRFNTAPGAWSQPRPFDRPGLIQTGPDGGIFCDPQIGCSDRLVALDLSTAKATQFSQEFRLGSDFDGPFNFSLGANFLRADSEDKYYVFINALTMAGSITLTANLPPYEPGVSDNSQCLANGPELRDPAGVYPYTCVYIDPNPIGSLNDQGHNYFLSKNPYRLISYAAFGEAYYNITDNLKITGGLRFTVDKKYAPRIPSWALAGYSYGYPVREVIEQEWNEPTGRLTLDWKPDLAFTDETMVYASYAHGYKAGGANPPPFVAVGSQAQNFGGVHPSETRPKTFAAEFLDAFELGAKSTFAEGRVTLNLAAFYYDYKDYQISEIVDRSAFNRNFDAEVWGLEIEADWRVLENLKFGFKGGYENTRIRDGERAIDLMDRTAGRDDWQVVRPFPTFASSCILPTWLFAHDGPPGGGVPGLYGLGAGGGAAVSGCEIAYFSGYDPVTNAPYVDLTNHVGPIVQGSPSTLYHWFPGDYPGWNPLDASQGHNYGEGFFKDLSGNELPNAPNFTATITADYTLPLPRNWLATLHTDLHWQSESWWRVFNDHEFGRLDEYFTMNLAAIFTNEEAGWNVMAYVKNVTDETAITGAFLNSDDTALTTNVFLTEPRLYGLRVTKAWSGGQLLGSFGARHEGPYPLTLELGGQAQRHEAPYETIRPGFAPALPASLDVFDEGQNNELDWGDGREVKLTWRPGGPWKVSAGLRYGKTNSSGFTARATEETDVVCGLTGTYYDAYCDPDYLGGVYYDLFNVSRTNWSNVSSRAREEFQLVDFTVGRETGIGGLSQSTVGIGMRFAQFESRTAVTTDAFPDWYIPEGWFFSPDYVTHSRYDATLIAQREFEGAGPILSWEASRRLVGNEHNGHIDVDWSVTGGVLFGKQNTTISGSERVTLYAMPGYALLGELWHPPIAPPAVTVVDISRNESASVPVLDLSLGLSYRIDRMSVSAGYRWERYFDVLDAGDDAASSFDRTIDGPYFKVAIGFGG